MCNFHSLPSRVFRLKSHPLPETGVSGRRCTVGSFTQMSLIMAQRASDLSIERASYMDMKKRVQPAPHCRCHVNVVLSAALKESKLRLLCGFSPSQVFRQTVQLCRLCWSAPDPGAQRPAQKPRQLLERVVHPEPPEIQRWQEIQHFLGAGQRLVHRNCFLINSL